MDFDDYQEKAYLTAQKYANTKDQNMMVPLLGLAGETGSLLGEFKKKIRDKQSYEGFDRKAQEELGDILWYLSCVASMLGISLDDIAKSNLIKTEERWPIDNSKSEVVELLDEDYPESEQFPRKLTIRIWQDDKTNKARMLWVEENLELGDPLTDNSHEDDGYRFHDVFHIAYMAVLGWSPVLRRMLKRKRKSMPNIDEVEDGARAAILEELIAHFVYANALDRNYYEGVTRVDTEMLFNIKTLVSKLEVRSLKVKQWEKAILLGFKLFREVKEKKKLTLKINLAKQEIKIVK